MARQPASVPGEAIGQRRENDHGFSRACRPLRGGPVPLCADHEHRDCGVVVLVVLETAPRALASLQPLSVNVPLCDLPEVCPAAV